MTRLQLHLLNWKDCTLCCYSETRKRIVLGKGKIPCDILFIGEAPGESEDSSGDPFDGQAGGLLDKICLMSGAFAFRLAYNNIVACFPMNQDAGEKEEPDHDCIMACKPRLEEYMTIASPKLIVTVGKQSTDYLDQTWREAVKVPLRNDDLYAGPVPSVSIQHPASIMRAPYVGRDLMVKKCVTTIRSAIKTYITGG